MQNTSKPHFRSVSSLSMVRSRVRRGFEVLRSRTIEIPFLTEIVAIQENFEIQSFMRRGVTHFIGQVSSAQASTKTKSINSVQPLSRFNCRFSHSLLQSFSITRPSRGIHYTMSPRNDPLARTNGGSKPLALPGGAPLKVKNSLSKEKVCSMPHCEVNSKEIFKPATGEQVTWYSCGPSSYNCSSSLTCSCL